MSVLACKRYTRTDTDEIAAKELKERKAAVFQFRTL